MNFENCIVAIVRFFYTFLFRKVIRENDWRQKTTYTAEDCFFTRWYVQQLTFIPGMVTEPEFVLFLKAIVWLYENCILFCGQTTSNE